MPVGGESLVIIPDNVSLELAYEVARHDLECPDNFRACLIGDCQGEREFKLARFSGCCGSFETVIQTDCGEKWLVGCNYGH